MKKIISIFVLISAFVAVLFFLNKRREIPNEFLPIPRQSTSSSTSVKPSPSQIVSEEIKNKLIEITITSEGLSQNNLTIQMGDTVKFLNSDTTAHWPASGLHPTHTLCSGFDSKHGLKQNESYSFTFNKKVVCSFHDHLHANNASLDGIITVK